MHRPNLHSLRFVGSMLLLLALLLAGGAHADYLGGITFDHDVPSYLPHDQRVYISIDYKIDDPGGGRIFARPYANGSLAPSYVASGAAVLAQGTGTTEQWFAITSGEITIDEIRIRLVSPDQTETWLEFFVPVTFVYGPHGVFDIQPNHREYSYLKHGMTFEVDFSYAVDAPSCRIFARPWNGSHLEPGYGASGSALLPPSGTYSQYFSFDADGDMSHIRFQVKSADQSELYAEFFVPFDLHWREIGIYDISFDHDDLTSLHNQQNVVASYTVDHDEPNGLYTWAWTMLEGSVAPGTVYQPSPLLPPGPTTVSRYTRIQYATSWSDAIHLVVGLPGDRHLEIDAPLLVHFGPHALPDVRFEPAPPAMLSYGERLEMEFDYATDEAAGVRIFGRAAFDQVGLFGMTSAGSPLYPAPSGVGHFWMYYASPTEANSIAFVVTNDDQSEQLFQWFEPGQFIWAESATITAAEAVAAATALGSCYPNPFNPTTTIPVTLARETEVRLAIYDLRGRLVRELHDGVMAAGRHAVPFDGSGLTSGVYLCRLESPAGARTQRLTLLK
ncbi:T9SS type A sorting domain-containing protein [bacterium]|nr:T9SS type A sorting domain-containing protein [bacterium]